MALLRSGGFSADERKDRALLHSRVFADFRNEREYFVTAFDLVLNIYKIAHHDPAVADLRESLREREIR